MLNVDPTKLPGRPTEWVALLDAIEHADPGDEQVWLEWKSTLDLTSRHDVGTILSKAILAMANRDPDDAGRTMLGHGIVIVGLEPGTIHGVTNVDNADLDKLVSLYVGADGPRWLPHLYTYAGKGVLIVVVDPPCWGDPIWTMRKQIDKYQDGTIFVRKRARSEPANSADIVRLSERLSRTLTAERLNIDVGVECPQPLAKIAWTAEGIDTAIDAERSHLMQPLLQERRDRAIPLVRASLYPAGMPNIGAALRTVQNMFPSEPEPRTEAQYEAEVQTYLDVVRQAMPEALVNVGSGLVPAPRFVATNLTQRNYQRLEVRVHIAGDIWARRTRSWKPELKESLPPRPRLWGPILTNYAQNMPAMYQAPHIPIPPRTTIEHDGSVTLTFLPVDLRPGKAETLEAECILLVPGHRDDPIIAEWSATATNADGQATGSFEIPFSGETVHLRTKREATAEDDD